jgi:phosphatidylserine decarboxylase
VRVPLTEYGRREIVLFGGAALAGTIATACLFPYATPVCVLALAFVLYFFRDPERRVPDDPGVLVAPADGRVVEVAEVDEPRFLREPAHKIAIFMSPMNVHVNRSPAAGVVEAVAHTPGGYAHAGHPEASAHNESQALVLAEVEGRTRILVRQVSGALARRIVCRARPGDHLARGVRFGMIKIGSRVEVYVPVVAGFEVTVALGQRVRAGETVLGRFR